MAPDSELFRRFDSILQRRPAEAEGGEAAPPPSLLSRSLRADWGEAEGVEEELRAEAAAVAERARSRWLAEWHELSSEARGVEDEVSAELVKPKVRACMQQADPSFDRAAAEEDSRRWHQSLWGGLGRLRKRVAALAQNSEQADGEGAIAGQLQAVARGIERELDVFKAQQRQEFDSFEATEPDAQEEALAVLCQRFEGWAAEASALQAPRSQSATAAAAPHRGRRARAASAALALDVPATGGSSSSLARTPSAASAGGDLGVVDADVVEDAVILEVKEELAALDAEISSAGGETGGWSNLEHHIFLRLFHNFGLKATPRFYAMLQERLPSMSEADLVDHVRWTADYEAKQTKRRLLLVKWRDRKADLARQAADARAEQLAQQAAQLRQAEKRERKAQAERRRKVTEWRAARDEEEQRSAAEQRVAAEEQARSERELQRSRQQQQREAAEAFRAQRDVVRAKAAREEATMRASASRAVSQEDRERIAKRSAEMLRKKLQQAASAAMAAAGPPRPPGQGKPNARKARAASCDHAESRLHHLTHSSAQRAACRPLAVAQAWIDEPDLPPPGAAVGGASHVARVLRAASLGPPPPGRLARPPSPRHGGRPPTAPPRGRPEPTTSPPVLA